VARHRRELAAAADVVITSVPNDSALDAVASGPDGILAVSLPVRSGST
jgi:3-hydroxyisobutyrate dehydrogenase-like beta-hydroxyacid dehydrogenase